MSDRETRQAESDRELDALLESHFPKQGFRNVSQYRKAKDAIVRLLLRKPALMQASLLKVLQTSLTESAEILLHELMAAKDGVPFELDDVHGADPAKQIDLKCEDVTNKAEVVPYRKRA